MGAFDQGNAYQDVMGAEMNRAVQQQGITSSQQEQQRAQQMQQYKVQGAQQEIDAGKLKQAAAQLDFSLQTLQGVNDQASYDRWRQNMHSNGIDTAGDPDVFDPAWKEQSMQQALSMKDQLGKYSAMNVTGPNGELQAMAFNTRTGAFSAPQGMPAGSSIASKGGEKLPAAAIQLSDKYQALLASGNTQAADSLLMFSKALEKNQTKDAAGNIILEPGTVEAVMQKAQAGETGQQAAKLQFAAPIAAATKVGEGEITPVEKKATAQKNVTGTLTSLADIYGQLASKGAVISSSNTPSQNLKARLTVSDIGQFVGGAIGTPEQSLIDTIGTMRPLLINDIRQASAMGARGMDSEKELAFYLQAATDPKRNIAANLAALANLNRAYGLGAGIKADPEELSRLQFEFKKSLGAAANPSKNPPPLGFAGVGPVPEGTVQKLPTPDGWEYIGVKK